MCLINCCGVNSTYTMHKGLLCHFTMCIALFWGILARHLLHFYGKLLVWFVSGGAAVHRPNVLWSTPPSKKSTIETTWVESPPMLKMVMPDRCQVECFYTVLFPNALYRPTIKCRQVWRPSHTLKAPG